MATGQSRKQLVQVLITTGKKPAIACRSIARAIFLSVPGSRLEFRGKRSLGSLIKKARLAHFSRVCAIYQENGKPSQIAFLSIEGPSPEWLSPKIGITSAKSAKKMPRRGQSSFLKLTGSKSRALQKLLCPPRPPEGTETGSSISAGAKTISFSLGKQKLATLGVSYAK